MKEIDYIQTDVLVIGSGLAGLRSGISALEKKSGIKVLIVSQGTGPVGSSFTNRNGKLGMQVCFTEPEKEAFVRETMQIASPGMIQPELVNLMAGESDDCFRFFKNHKIRFQRDEKGLIARLPGCFSPDSERAVVFSDLGQAFQNLNNKYLALSGNRIDNFSLLFLLNQTAVDGRQVCGGLFVSEKTGKYCVVSSKVTILATGGTTPLFFWNVGGDSLSGYSPALLKNAGAEIVNEGFHQFIWHNTQTLEPVYPARYLQNGAMIRNGVSHVKTIPEIVLASLADRTTHVPAAYGFPDIEMERFLLNLSDRNGVVSFITPEQKLISAALFAHAWNGGAKIDVNGWTGVPGLFACGECASGMHGANRLGGAMVLATQVFGRRAGAQAARILGNMAPVQKSECIIRAGEIINAAKKTSVNYIDSSFKKRVYMNGLFKLCNVRKAFDETLNTQTAVVSDTESIQSTLMADSAGIIL